VQTAHRQLPLHELHRDGFSLVADVISTAEVEALTASLVDLESQAAIREKAGATYAVRRLCDLSDDVRRLSRSPNIRAIIEPVLGPSARLVRSLLFDKNPAANWKVPWHQDLTIAVKQRRDVPGFGPWSIKAGVPHVQPSVHVLENMLTVRLHLDDCGDANGPLRVLPGSHRLGVIDALAIADLRRRITETVCTLNAGSVLLMRPLLLHASAPATMLSHRRVVHLEFAAADLPGGLEWSES
jgi:ectoine hydroxylase-related dioxygenase (phytanoyl-CoA dioxygenase family)